MKQAIFAMTILAISSLIACQLTKHWTVTEVQHDTTTKRVPDSSVLMDMSQGKLLLKDCSGSVLVESVDSFWSPNNKDYLDLESNFFKLDSQFNYLGKYIIQYVGVIRKGSRYIYINAFNRMVFKEKDKEYDLRSSPLVFCGGGSSFWRVLYNVNLKEFEKVQFNAPK